MPLTEVQLRTKLLKEVGDPGNGLVAQSLDSMWQHRDSLDIYSRYLRVRVDAILLLLANPAYWALIQTSGDGRTMHSEQVYTHLQWLYRTFALEWNSHNQDNLLGREPEVSEMEAMVPVPGNEGWPDPSDPAYYGSPIARQLAGL